MKKKILLSDLEKKIKELDYNDEDYNGNEDIYELIDTFGDNDIIPLSNLRKLYY